jgi:hypothetical protein
MSLLLRKRGNLNTPRLILSLEEAAGDNDWTLADIQSAPTDATAYFEALNDGTFNISDSSGTRELWELKTWINAFYRTATIGEDYEIKVVMTIGSYADFGSHPAVNTYADCDTGPRWGWTQSGVGSTSVTGTITVREKANTANQATALFTINLDVV